jgi:hypothetical protein
MHHKKNYQTQPIKPCCHAIFMPFLRPVSLIIKKKKKHSFFGDEPKREEIKRKEKIW